MCLTRKAMFYPLSHPELIEKPVNRAEGELQWTKGRKKASEKGTPSLWGRQWGALLRASRGGALGQVGGSSGKNCRPRQSSGLCAEGSVWAAGRSRASKGGGLGICQGPELSRSCTHSAQ